MNTMRQVRATSPRRERSPRRPAARLVPCVVCEMPVLTREPAPLCYVCQFAQVKVLAGQEQPEAASELEATDDELDEMWDCYRDHMDLGA